MKNRKELVEKIIKEAIGGDALNISTSVNIINYKDNPLVQELVKILEKEFKKEDSAELQFIHENGDIWEFGIRFEIQEPSQQMQFTREIAKSKAYEIKRKLEEMLMPKFNIPSFSIQGVRTMKSKEGKVYCDFAISLIYANKGNLKVTYESYNRLVESIIEAEFTEGSKDREMSHTGLEKSMREWEVLSQQIKKHEEDFKAMIEEKLKAETALKEKIFTIMETLDVKTKKVDKIVAKIKAGGWRSVGPTPTEKVTILMSKLNEATKKVVEQEFFMLSKDVPFSAHKSISVEEGVIDKVKAGYEYVKSKLSPWFTSLKDMFSLTNELEKEVSALNLTEDFQDLDSLTKVQEPGDKSRFRDRFKQEDIVSFVKKYPGATETEIYKNVYGMKYNKDYKSWMGNKKAADLIRRALDAGKIVRTKELKKNKATFTYWTPEDLQKFQDFQKQKGIKNIKLK